MIYKNYEILIVRSAVKSLKSIPNPYKNRIKQVIDDLPNNRSTLNVKKLTAQPGYRIRVGVYRILYVVDSAEKTITIVAIKHRKDSY